MASITREGACKERRSEGLSSSHGGRPRGIVSRKGECYGFVDEGTACRPGTLGSQIPGSRRSAFHCLLYADPGPQLGSTELAGLWAGFDRRSQIDPQWTRGVRLTTDARRAPAGTGGMESGGAESGEIARLGFRT